MWCNVDTNHPELADQRVVHKACPVRKPHEKLGMNIWIRDRSVLKA